MTQQPIQGYPPQYPQAPQPQQPYPAQQYAPPAPQQAYPAPYQQPYAPQQQQPYAAPQQPAQPLAQGTLDDYYSQPSSSSGPSISWSANGQQKPLGTTYVGIVARDVTHADVQHQTDPTSGQPQFYRDGRPKFVMKVPLTQVMGGNPQQGVPIGPLPQEFADGEATWFVRGQGRDELTRAMNAAGLTGQVSPKAGDVIQVTLMQRRPSRMGNPANIVQVVFQPGPGHQAQQAPQQAPVQTPAAAQAAPVTEAASPAPVAASQPAQPVQQPVQPDPALAYAQQQAQAYAQPVQQAPQFQGQAQGQLGVQPQPPAPQPPTDLNPDQQALLARLTGQQG